MEKKMESTIIGYIGTAIRIHSFNPSQPKVSLECRDFGALGFRVHGQLVRVYSLETLVKGLGLDFSDLGQRFRP